MVPATTYLTEVGKWAHMQEMPREGYWHNNERDTLRGLLLHYLRTSDPRAFHLAALAARHAFDVDVRHHPHYGLYTHSYGHCYRALGSGGEPDHAWLLGALEWACVSGDPVLADWALRCGDYLAGLNVENFARTDLRTTSLQLHMLTTYYRYTGQDKFLQAARRVAEILREAQLDSGLWMPYLGDPKQTHSMNMAFANHTILALADYIDATHEIADQDPNSGEFGYEERGDDMLPVLQKAVEAYCGAGQDQWDVGEVGLILPGLDLLWQRTREVKYAQWAQQVYDTLCANQCLADDPRVRGEFWPTWGVNQPEGKKRPGRPPQFGHQARPLTPSTVLAYGVLGMRAVAEGGRP
jgi:hypothetical protein